MILFSFQKLYLSIWLLILLDQPLHSSQPLRSLQETPLTPHWLQWGKVRIIYSIVVKQDNRSCWWFSLATSTKCVTLVSLLLEWSYTVAPWLAPCTIQSQFPALSFRTFSTFGIQTPWLFPNVCYGTALFLNAVNSFWPTSIYSISQKWVHPSHFCKYLSISFHVTTLKKWHFATM